MVGLSSDTITLPLLPRTIPRSTGSSNAKFVPLVVARNMSPLRHVNEVRHFDMHPWPEWARIAFLVSIGLASLLFLVLFAFLCSRRRQRDGMTTVSQKDTAAYESTSTIGVPHEAALPYSQIPYGGYIADTGNDVTQPQQAMAPPRPLGAQVLSPNENGMYDVPLQTSYGYGPVNLFAPGQHDQHTDPRLWRSGSQRSIGTSTMTSQNTAPVVDQGSAFSPWNSPTKKKFKL